MKKKHSSCSVAEMRYRMKFLRRAKISRDCLMASTTTPSPSLVSTMSAAARAASVAPCTAMPTSARLSAGASLTPSPVIPQRKPAWRSVSTMRYLCSGNTCAKPSAGTIISAYFATRSSGTAPPSPSTGSPSDGLMLVPRDSTRAVSTAITVWSPVIIFTDTPKRRHSSMVHLVSSRGGSRKVRIPSIFQSPSASSWRATASERMPLFPSSKTFASTSALIASLLCVRSRMTLGAPLVILNTLPSGPLSVPSVRLVRGSKGMNSVCSYLSHLRKSWPDVASTIVSRASRGGSRHLAASAAWNSTVSLFSPGVKVGQSSWMTILLRVRVPVLSEQSMSMPAISSMALRRVMMAPWPER
mmetsp:Transcript_34137/g.83948  ORF Transcript_34137/g.83948 Transcript_34137/m.83948 type:complete len:357 (+) Transcript_34137:1024-2094(+)